MTDRLSIPNRRARTDASPVGRSLLLVLAIALGAAACGDSDDGSADSSASASSDSIATTTTTTAATTTSQDAATSTSSSTTEPTTSSSTSTTLAGENFDGFADDGDVLAVMGVADDDVLNVRAGPGTDQAILTTAQPTANDLVATGRARLLTSSIWYEVTVNGETGWASSSFMGFEAATDDATAEFLDGQPPIGAETLVDLGLAVADGFASEDPPSSIEQSVAPVVGDLGEVSYDVIGIGDDSIAGFRLHIFATPSEGGEGWVLKSIERTTFCWRGTSGELCS